MKKWKAAELNCLDISETAHKLSWDLVYDGGYIGDGSFGWFGGSEKDNDKPNPTPTPTPDPTPDPAKITS